MPRIAYVNGAYVPFEEATVHVEDRGLQFSDGIYEVYAVLNGKLLDRAPHMARLERSLKEMKIVSPMSPRALDVVMGQLVRRNRCREGLLYLQINRGVAPRNHAFPKTDVPPSLMMTVRPFSFAGVRQRQQTGVRIHLTPDQRWARRDIKSVSLLANCMAKQAAVEAKAFEAWMVTDDGQITEGSSTTAFIIDAKGQIITRRLGNEVLPSVTRLSVLEIAEHLQMRVEERAFSVEELMSAREAFLASSSSFITPVVDVDGAPVGDGMPGPVTRRLIEQHWKLVIDQTGYSAMAH